MTFFEQELRNTVGAIYLIAAVSDYTELFETQVPVMRQEQTM